MRTTGGLVDWEYMFFPHSMERVGGLVNEYVFSKKKDKRITQSSTAAYNIKADEQYYLGLKVKYHNGINE